MQVNLKNGIDKIIKRKKANNISGFAKNKDI